MERLYIHCHLIAANSVVTGAGIHQRVKTTNAQLHLLEEKRFAGIPGDVTLKTKPTSSVGEARRGDMRRSRAVVEQQHRGGGDELG